MNSTSTRPFLSPDHNETLSIAKNIDKDIRRCWIRLHGWWTQDYVVSKSVTDGGINWELAEIDRKEKPTEYGMYWCWIW